jgi:ornithine cyclodeaminase/alanine dehydrogenase-like protein (mu-crystallin family)
MVMQWNCWRAIRAEHARIPHVARYLGPGDIDRLFAEGHVGAADCIAAVEASFREHGEGDVGVLPRAILTADGLPPVPRSRALKLSASYMRGSRMMGASIYSTHFRPGDVDMWITLFSGESGRMHGVLSGKALSLWKTGATAAVAARHLARADATRAALIGTGRYARTQVQCLAQVRAIGDLACYSRDAARLAAFVEWAAAALPATRVVAARSAEAAVRDADIVATITTSPVPVVEGAWLAPGSHCNAMGQHAPDTRELDTAAVTQARIVVDARDQAFAEKGEIVIPLAAGDIARERIAELGEVIAARAPGRASARERTVFCSGGTALEYMGLCELFIDRARAAGLGQELND